MDLHQLYIIQLTIMPIHVETVQTGRLVAGICAQQTPIHPSRILLEHLIGARWQVFVGVPSSADFLVLVQHAQSGKLRLTTRTAPDKAGRIVELLLAGLFIRTPFSLFAHRLGQPCRNSVSSVAILLVANPVAGEVERPVATLAANPLGRICNEGGGCLRISPEKAEVLTVMFVHMKLQQPGRVVGALA